MSRACEKLEQTMAGKCADHDKVMETIIKNTSAIEHAQTVADLRHQEYREDMKELKAMLRPPSASIQMSQNQGTGSSAGGDWSKLWVSILLIALVVVGALFVKLGLPTSASASTETGRMK